MFTKAFYIFLLLGSFIGYQIKPVIAQDVDDKWALKLSYSMLKYNGELGNQLFKFDEFSQGGGVAFSRYLNSSFDILLGLDYNRLDLNGKIQDSLYFSKGNLFQTGVLFNYKFDNGYLLPVNSKLKPFIGFGFNSMIGKTSGISYELKGEEFSHFIDEIALNISAGLKYQITKRTSVFVEFNDLLATTEELDGAAIDLKNDKYYTGKIGLIIKLGRDKDQDKDGVTDDKDECPDTPFGVKVDEKGCPLDRDKDGIPDYEDDCPDDPGLPEYNGCPDRDGDGIIDKNDDCPDLPGIPKYKGCPDSDGDGVIDPNDLCPDTQAGVEVDEYGCPIDTDGDGLTDDVDQCPDEYGPMEYLGCPEPPDVVWPTVENETKSEVYFETDKSELDPEQEEEMQKIVKYLFENPSMNIRLYGFADPRGSKEYNEVLSAKRVETVKNYLRRKGIPESRILVKARGEVQDVKSAKGEENMTEDQKLRKYRKVQFDTYFFMK